MRVYCKLERSYYKIEIDMVEIDLRRQSEQQLIDGTKEIKLNMKDTASAQQTTSGSDHEDNSSGIQADEMSANSDAQEIDMNLVNEARALLKDEFEKDSEGKYSAVYYEELMDSQSAATCWRFIIHAQFDMKAALELMKQTLEWRKSYGVDQILEKNDEAAKEFWLFGPMHWTGTDRQGQDVVYVVGRNYRKPESDFKPYIRRFVTHSLFTWDREHHQDLDQFTVVFDVSNSGYRNIDLDFTTWLISVRDHLPARMKAIFIVGIPFILQPVIKMVIGWLPDTYKRITHCGTIEGLIHENIDPTQLPLEAGGQRQEEFYRLAPKDAPWAADTEIFSSEKMQKAIHDCIGFAIDKKRKERLEQLQRDFEAGKLDSALTTPEKKSNK